MADQRALIGTSLDQVSTNAMLGTLAFQDADGAYIETIRGATALEGFNKDIADTAVDVFVYDTHKDSDGGAWRHRTQHTSWYNETLNTATRGARKEFPAVAVIVAESTKLTIYDGDDPDLPMWMVFNKPSAGYTEAIAFGNNIRAVYHLNGKLSVSTNDGHSLIDFISEDCRTLRASTQSNKNAAMYGGIVNRNGNMTFVTNAFNSSYNIGNSSSANDVAMTVLPNAPIDSATGLPIPTIAVATDGGVSVIKDDGTVVDLTRSGYVADFVEFIEYNGIKLLCYLDNNSGVEIYSPGVFEIPNSDVDLGDVVLQRFTRDQAPIALGALQGPPTSVSNSNIDKGNSSGLTRIYLQGSDNTTKVQSAAVYITSDYNTGWMHGSIKGAFLSDTTVESFSPSNLVTEDFSANWTGATNGVISVSSGQLTITNTGGSNGRAVSNQFATTSGKKYAFIAKGVSSTGGGTYRLEVRGPELVATSLTAGTLVIYFNGTGNSTTHVELYAIGGDGVTVTYEDAYVVELEEDRSVNNKGLQVFGTVTKSPVATGAELVAYSGFSNSTNYLSQPLNSDLAIGNSDFSCVGWFKKSTSSNTGIIIFASDGNNQVFDVRVHTDMKMLAQITDDGFSTREIVSTQGPTVNDNIWHQFHAVRRSNTLYSYLDGNLLGSSAVVEANITNSMGIVIGAEGLTANQKAFEGNLALIRFSQSAPSAEQIKKIYEDEKVLFQENSAATLYGSSDAVTALAYDDSTSLLHVGTSSGRSEFKGLRRVGNTTTAVTTAISASSGLVAEQ